LKKENISTLHKCRCNKTERMYVGVTKELRKEWEKEITEETEGGKQRVIK